MKTKSPPWWVNSKIYLNACCCYLLATCLEKCNLSIGHFIQNWIRHETKERILDKIIGMHWGPVSCSIEVVCGAYEAMNQLKHVCMKSLIKYWPYTLSVLSLFPLSPYFEFSQGLHRVSWRTNSSIIKYGYICVFCSKCPSPKLENDVSACLAPILCLTQAS